MRKGHFGGKGRLNVKLSLHGRPAVGCGKTAEPIEMPFRLNIQMQEPCIWWGPDHPMRIDNFSGKLTPENSRWQKGRRTRYLASGGSSTLHMVK